MKLLVATIFLIMSSWSVGTGAEVDPGGSFRVMTDEVPFYYRSCDSNGNCKEINRNGTVKLTCYDKMRQAMKIMDLWHKRSPDVSKYMDAYMQDLRGEVEQKWDETMKACVNQKGENHGR